MPLPEQPERRRIAKAMLAYAGGHARAAKLLGIPTKTLTSRLNTRGEHPKPEFLVAIAEAFGLPVDFAIHGWHAIEGWEPNDVYDDAMASLSDAADREAERHDGISSGEEGKTDDADG